MNQASNFGEAVSVGSWIGTMLLCCIPLVGLIMMFVWAFGDATNPSKKNWARAALILTLVVVFLYLIIFLAMGISFARMFNSFY
jgi:hypothetical protein